MLEKSVLKEKFIKAASSYNEWLASCEEKDSAFDEAKRTYDTFLKICSENSDGAPSDSLLSEKIKKAQRDASVSADAARNSKKKNDALKIQSMVQIKEAKKLFDESGISFEELLPLLFEK